MIEPLGITEMSLASFTSSLSFGLLGFNPIYDVA